MSQQFHDPDRTGGRPPGDQRTVVALVVGGILGACLVVGAIFVFGSNSDGKKAQSAATPRRDQTTSTVATPTLPPGPREPAEAMGIVLPANDLVVWKPTPEAARQRLIEGMISAGAAMVDGDVVTGDAAGESGFVVFALERGYGGDVRSQQFVDDYASLTPRDSSAPRKFMIGDRPAFAVTTKDGELSYTFGMSNDISITVVAVHLTEADLLQMSEAIIAANP